MCKGKHPDSLYSVACNWNVLGIFCGFRLFEWAQNSSDKKKSLESGDGLALDSVTPDLIFLGVDRNTIPSHGRRNSTTPASDSSSSNSKHIKF